ncbi:MAG: 30S ribosomal protein S8e [Candidatus Thalassarchaeum betae]|nr:30S ribosomal protein S8e [Candidatus Thalassoarchaea betae]
MKRPSRYRGKRRREISSENQFAYVGAEDKRKGYRKRAGSQTVRVMLANQINVSDPKEGKTTRATISGVVENDADPNYVRRNIITKGAILDTDVGLVRVTSRPGMDGVVCGVLLED